MRIGFTSLSGTYTHVINAPFPYGGLRSVYWCDGNVVVRMYIRRLLAVMVFSGLFEEEFIDQVQVVGYFHQWEATPERAGRFVLWQNSSELPIGTDPHPGSGSAVDGSKTVHASSVYHPEAAFEQAAAGELLGRGLPAIDKSKGAELRYTGEGDRWELVQRAARAAEEEVRARYHTDDLRFSIVYRARCFASAADVQRHADQQPEDIMSLQNILE